MATYKIEWNFAFLKQPNEVWARYIQNICRLLGREFLMNWHESDCVTFPNMPEQLHQKF